MRPGSTSTGCVVSMGICRVRVCSYAVVLSRHLAKGRGASLAWGSLHASSSILGCSDSKLTLRSRLLPAYHLLKEELVNFNIAVVHHQVLGQEILEGWAINNIKLAVALQAINQAVNASLVLVPILLVFLNLALGTREVLIKLLKVIVIVKL